MHRQVWVYTCQNATLLEITCHGSYTVETWGSLLPPAYMPASIVCLSKHMRYLYLLQRPGLEVIKLEFILRLKIKSNDWLLADTCVCKQPIIALYFESENVLKLYNLETSSLAKAGILWKPRLISGSDELGQFARAFTACIHTIMGVDEEAQW